MKKILSIKILQEIDEDPDTSYLEQEEFKQRLKEYQAGEFGFIGIRAEAEIQLSPGGTIQTISSGGLWGIEDDSDRKYLEEIASEQLEELKSELISMGFSVKQVNAVDVE